MKLRTILFFLFALILAAAPAFAQDTNPTECVENYDASVDYFPDKVESVYADDWHVTYHNHYKVVTVGPVGDADAGTAETNVLVQCGTPIPELTGELEGAFVIEIPVETIFETSGGGSISTGLEVLGEADALIGLGYVPPGEFEEYSPAIAARFDDPDFLVANVADSGWEAVLAAAPDLIVEPFNAERRMQAREFGMSALFYNSYWETPLGGAEHIKFWSMLFNKEALANDLFEPIERDYLELRARVEAEILPEERPTVLHGELTEEDAFFTFGPGRMDYHLIRDAGGVPILPESSEIVLEAFSSLSLETVISVAENADFWWNTTYYADERFNPPTAETVIADNPLNASFSAVERGNTFHIFRRGEDLYKTAMNYRADLLLRDLVSILHPELLPDYEPLWMQPIAASES
jgi:iron complex transport system substrate-binding protein